MVTSRSRLLKTNCWKRTASCGGGSVISISASRSCARESAAVHLPPPQSHCRLHTTAQGSHPYVAIPRTPLHALEALVKTVTLRMGLAPTRRLESNDLNLIVSLGLSHAERATMMGRLQQPH
eukprot:5849479-Amphidinium_carterae.2